jgi:hypothetical protein
VLLKFRLSSRLGLKNKLVSSRLKLSRLGLKNKLDLTLWLLNKLDFGTSGLLLKLWLRLILSKLSSKLNSKLILSSKLMHICFL